MSPFARMLIIAAALAAGVAPPALSDTPVKFSLDWKFEGPSAPFLVALEKGYFKDEGLDVTIDSAGGSLEPINRVAAGTYDMGFGDLNAVIKFRDANPGVDLKPVFMVYDKPAFAVVGRKSLGITDDPKSLEGKKLGAPAPDAAWDKWPIYKSVNAIDDGAITVENVGFPVREPMLAKGDVDAIFGFSFSSYINLKANGVPEDDIVVQLMADNGVALYGNSILVSPAFAAEHPEAVKGFLRAFVKGLKDTIADPEGAVAYVIARNEVAKPATELERLKMALAENILTDAVKANGLGKVDPARLAEAIDQIGLTYEFKAKPDAATVFDASFLPDEAVLKVE
ncbi:ABC transporter substrate-binding protein [Pseudoxanthobacter sp. M-2]|uniref:ABC transporter substrate-binding protein n=1 Tax=Pseudoxanthobacter sp. M-2 TaxID=3078754 RepID=UPI0038FBF816